MLNRMQTRMAKLRQERAEGDDKGFTLIELLVVVVIIGILIAIAIPLYLHFENGAKNNSAQSDVHNAIATVNQCANDNNGTLPASTDATGGTPKGTDLSFTCGGTAAAEVATVSSGNTLAYTNAGTTYTLVGTQTDTTDAWTYDSATGKITKNVPAP